MRRILFGLTAGVLGIVGMTVLSGTADAKGFHGHGISHGHAYYHSYGHRFRGGYFYYRDHCPVWTRRVWNTTLLRWEYLEPDLNVWYYYYAPGSCYYPVSYCP